MRYNRAMQIEYNNKIYDIEIIRKNNKNLYIRVKDNKVVITCNYFTTKKEIERIINNNYNAIIKMIEKKEKNKEKNNKFFLFGKEYNIIYNNSKIEIIDNNIFVKDEITLNKWLDKYIKTTFKSHLEYLYNNYKEKIPVPNLKIRKMKTRWGVCNINNHNVTLNKELYKYDIECLDYVIIHELSHFIHPNHSSDFWYQVSKYCPNYKEIKKKLND